MTVKRKAFLVSYSGWDLDQGKRLKGVSRDVARYKKYLMSNHGGAWRSNEIDVVTDGRLATIEGNLDKIRKEHNHVVFTVYTGHGKYDWEKECHLLMISQNEKIVDKSFFNLADRQISIFDCCSNITFPATREESLLTSESVFEKVATDSEWYRKSYEEACMACPPQSLIFYATGEGHSAYATPNGSVYTKCLLDRLETSEVDMDFMQAHDLAYYSVFLESNAKKECEDIQIPVAYASCKDSYLPAAIVSGKSP